MTVDTILFSKMEKLKAVIQHDGPNPIASGIIMPYMSRAKKRIGSEIGSKALRSDGSCSMVCAYMSWILLAGVVLTALLGWWWIDSIVALALVYYVVKEGWEAVEEARGKEDAYGCSHD